MKRLLTILLIVLVAFAVVATVISSRQKAAETPAPEAPAAEPAEPADAPAESAEPVVIRSLDLDAIRALHSPDEAALSLDGETVTWQEYCEWLGQMGHQIEDYFRQMASYYGMTADWEGSVGDGSGMTFAQYAVHETNANLSSILSYRRFAAQEQITLTDEERGQLTDEALAKSMLGENATAEQLASQLESEGFSLETYRRIRETSLLLDKYMAETYGAKGEKLADEEVVAYMEGEGYVSAAHILLMTMDPNTGDKLDEAAVAEKQLKAQELTDELRAIEDPEKREERFLALMGELSEDGGCVAYPKGYTYQPGIMVQEFEAAVAALQPGEVSDPVESVYGYHVIMRLPLRPESLLYSAQGMPVSGREEAAAAAMNKKLGAFMDENPVSYAEGIEDLDLTKYIK